MEYIEVSFEISPFKEDYAEQIIALIEDLDFESFLVEEPCLKAYIQLSKFSEPNLKTLLSALTYESFDVKYSAALIPEENWNKSWESSFEPIVVDKKCTVKASFHKGLPRTRYQITIDPKMAFGTGHHQTTYLMLDSILEDCSAIKDKQVLDMGCGTGILAILAAKMGAKSPVHAIDIDYTAVLSSIENSRRNRVSGKIITKCGDASLLQAGKYDTILANINRNILLSDISTYSRSMRNDGTLYVSGFYTEDIPLLVAEASKHSLKMVSTKEKENWAVIKFKKILEV